MVLPILFMLTLSQLQQKILDRVKALVTEGLQNHHFGASTSTKLGLPLIIKHANNFKDLYHNPFKITNKLILL